MTTHVSTAKVTWKGGFDGQGHVCSPGFTTSVNLPQVFGGLHEGASPEDLLLSAVISCFAATLGIILDKANVVYEALAVHGDLVTDVAVPASIREINLVVDIVTDAPLGTIEKLAARVDTFCVVAKAMRPDLKKTVRIDHMNHRPLPSCAQL